MFLCVLRIALWCIKKKLIIIRAFSVVITFGMIDVPFKEMLFNLENYANLSSLNHLALLSGQTSIDSRYKHFVDYNQYVVNSN